MIFWILSVSGVIFLTFLHSAWAAGFHGSIVSQQCDETRGTAKQGLLCPCQLAGKSCLSPNTRCTEGASGLQCLCVPGYQNVGGVCKPSLPCTLTISKETLLVSYCEVDGSPICGLTVTASNGCIGKLQLTVIPVTSPLTNNNFLVIGPAISHNVYPLLVNDQAGMTDNPKASKLGATAVCYVISGTDSVGHTATTNGFCVHIFAFGGGICDILATLTYPAVVNISIVTLIFDALCLLGYAFSITIPGCPTVPG